MKAGLLMRGAVVLASCSRSACSPAAAMSDGVSYSDKQIIDKLNLEKSGNGYAIDGDPFCEVEGKLLNDADEVVNAADRDDLGRGHHEP